MYKLTKEEKFACSGVQSFEMGPHLPSHDAKQNSPRSTQATDSTPTFSFIRPPVPVVTVSCRLLASTASACNLLQILPRNMQQTDSISS